MSLFPLKATSTYVKAYYAALKQFHEHGHTTEGNTRSAFADLLKRCASPYDWHLVEEYQFKGTAKQPLRADGALVDSLTLVHGLWEAKDSADDLQREIKSKVARGYPLTNILFQSPDRAVLYQDSRIALDCDLTHPDSLIEVLQLFFEHRQPHEVDWEEAVLKFSEKIPDLAAGVTTILEAEHKKNADFREKFQSFADLCRQSINPDLTDPAIQKMLVQHLLTERIFRKVFNNQEFLSRNVIAAEIEKVIHSITAKHFSRDTFLKPLDRFYTAIEKAAESQTGYTEKQHFLNAVYEKFFQSFDRNQADTHGIVYTPQPIVDFMVRSVEEVLKQEFGKSLSDEGVHILDPFTGTGNFITRIMQQIKTSRLPHKYTHELHCNEIMLLPYYIASMNIEHAYMERIGDYQSFEGICLVDTFELSEFGQQSFAFSDSNTARVLKQKKAPIFVVIGNPPYNMGQANESDQNKNRKYKHWDNRIKDTYTKDSKATLRNKLSDPYVKAFRWASDRIRNGGVIAFVTNNSFVDQVAFDGMRKHLARDFNTVTHLDLKGNARTSGEQRRKEAGNVFDDQIRVGIGITLLVKNPNSKVKSVRVWQVADYLKADQKKRALDEFGSVSAVPALEINPDKNNNWLTKEEAADFAGLLRLGDKKHKATSSTESIFRTFSLGLVSSRDSFVYNTSADSVRVNARRMIKTYSAALANNQQTIGTDEEPYNIKWSRQTLASLRRHERTQYSDAWIREAIYRPFDKRFVYFDDFWNEERYKLEAFFPKATVTNSVICVSQNPRPGNFFVIATNQIADFHLAGDTQCYAFYRFAKDDTSRRENITDWALAQYRSHYSKESITKWDIFHSTYALLHHPEYRARYAANLKRELPRIPFPPDIAAFADAGKRLMELHIDYEQQPEYPLEEIEHPGTRENPIKWTFRVEKMSLSKDKTELRYNEALTLRGIPPACFEYRLGNRSALEWVIDQYRVSTDKRSGIVNDLNRAEDERYILRLIGQVITVSLETQEIIRGLPSLNLGA